MQERESRVRNSKQDIIMIVNWFNISRLKIDKQKMNACKHIGKCLHSMVKWTLWLQMEFLTVIFGNKLCSLDQLQMIYSDEL